MTALAAAAVMALALGIQATRLVGSPGTSPRPVPSATGSAAGTPAPSVPPPNLLSLASASYATGRMDNSAVGVGFGSVWVGAWDGGVVVRMNPSDGSIQAQVEMDAAQAAEMCGTLQASETWIWFQTCGRGPSVGRGVAETVRVDPESNRIEAIYEEPGPDGIGIGVLDGSAWFISDAPAGGLTAVDDTGGGTVETLRLDAPVGFLTAGFGSLWVSPDSGLELWRVDPATGDRLATIPLSSQPGFVNVSTDAVWVALPDAGQLARVDPGQDRVVATFEIAPRVEQIVVSERHVWAVASTEVVGIDPVGNAEAARYRVPAHPARGGARLVMAAGFDQLWWADRTTLYAIPEP